MNFDENNRHILCANDSVSAFKCQTQFYTANDNETCASYFANFTTLDNFCNSNYDGRLCWAPVSLGSTVLQSCSSTSDVSEFTRISNISIHGNYAARYCTLNGNWNETDYSHCDKFSTEEDVPGLILAIRYIFLTGSLLSLLMLIISLYIFLYFKCLNCSRIRIHRNFCTALILNTLLLFTFILFLVYDESFMKTKIPCRIIVTAHLYFCMARVNWMLVEGFHLHSRVTTHIFKKKAPFKLYYFIGWGLPLVCIIPWVVLISVENSDSCGINQEHFKIYLVITIPMIAALLVNVIFLANIIRILVRRRHIANKSNDDSKLGKAVKATVFLSPILGFPYLLFIIAPSKEYYSQAIYYTTYIVFHSTHGIFFSLFYCFFNEDVQTAVKSAFAKRFLKKSSSKTSTTCASSSVSYKQKTFINKS